MKIKLGILGILFLLSQHLIGSDYQPPAKAGLKAPPMHPAQSAANKRVIAGTSHLTVPSAVQSGTSQSVPSMNINWMTFMPPMMRPKSDNSEVQELRVANHNLGVRLAEQRTHIVDQVANIRRLQEENRQLKGELRGRDTTITEGIEVIRALEVIRSQLSIRVVDLQRDLRLKTEECAKGQ